MEARYADLIESASKEMVEIIFERESDLPSRALLLDQHVRALLRHVGQQVVEGVLHRLADAVVSDAQRPGLNIHRSPCVSLSTLFGPVQVRSPYLFDRDTGASDKPVRRVLGVRHNGRTPGVERALTDFGIEEAFGQAEKRFEEHYGWRIGRTTILRVVEGHGEQAESFVAKKLEEAREAYDEPIATRPGKAELLVELDGCEIRTGSLHPSESGGLSPVRQLPRRRREQAWREVRVGLARPLDEVSASYVAGIASYPEICAQLFDVAVVRGLSSETDVVVVTDGAHGLRDGLLACFAEGTHLLDRPHLRENCHAAAEAQGLEGEPKTAWVEDIVAKIHDGDIDQVLTELDGHTGTGAKRVRQLRGFLARFRDSFGYADALDRGWPIGSGEVESAHRHLPQKRLKLPGAWWRVDTVNKMLALRVVRANGWWDEYWTQHCRELAVA